MPLNIFLVAVLCAVATLANSESACWMPAKYFSSQTQEPQGRENHYAVHAARRTCRPGTKKCNLGIIKWYPGMVKDINAHQCAQVLTYPAKTMSWISGAKLKGNELFLIVGTKNGRDTRLCRSIVRTQTVIGENWEGESSCTVKINGVPEVHSKFEILVINKHGKSMKIKPKVRPCKHNHPVLCGGGWDGESTSDDESPHPSTEENFPSMETGAPAKKPPTTSGKGDKDHSHSNSKPAPSSESSQLHSVSIEQSSAHHDDDENQHHHHQGQPCWSDLHREQDHLGNIHPIGFVNRRKVYLVRMTSKARTSFGTYCPTANKISAFGRKQSSEGTTVQILNVRPGTIGWALTTQKIYRWRIPRNALIVGKFAGIPYALHQEPTYYTICRPDVPSWTRNNKLLLGLANSQTGLCEAMFGGQIAYFTRFHILITSHESHDRVNAVQECSDIHPDEHLDKPSASANWGSAYADVRANTRGGNHHEFSGGSPSNFHEPDGNIRGVVYDNSGYSSFNDVQAHYN